MDGGSVAFAKKLAPSNWARFEKGERQGAALPRLGRKSEPKSRCERRSYFQIFSRTEWRSRVRARLSPWSHAGLPLPLKAKSLLAFGWATKKPSARVILSDLFGYQRIKVSLSKTGGVMPAPYEPCPRIGQVRQTAYRCRRKSAFGSALSSWRQGMVFRGLRALSKAAGAGARQTT